jgi:hypothetical protein
MAILIDCACGKKLSIRAELAGKRVKCPACSAKLLAPVPAPVAHQAAATVTENRPAPTVSLPPPRPPERSAARPKPLAPPLPPPEPEGSKKQATLIGDYVIEGTLGRGAHGTVYRAHARKDPATPVALKVVEKRGNLDLLLLEPALLSQLDHPCIVGLKDYFVAGEDLVLALEFIEGKDLTTELDEGRAFSQAEVRDLLVQLAAALAQAHGRNIIHRDLKPSNILVVREKGQARFVLTDFGIGRRAEGIQVEKHGGGTYLFMAPEQLRGRPGPQSDLWALGVVAYRLLTGKLPFPGPTLQELSNQILYAAPAPPSQVCAQPLDSHLEAIVLRLLDKSLQERFASAEEVLEALGFQGAPEKVLARARRSGSGKPGQSLDRQLIRAMGVRLTFLVLAVVLYLLSGGVLSGTLLLLGMVCFFFAQSRKSVALTFVALVVLGFICLRFINPYVYAVDSVGFLWLLSLVGRLQMKVLQWLGPGLGPLVWVWFSFAALALLYALVYLFLPVFAGWMYISLRRLQRQRVLRQAALAGKADRASFLKIFRNTLDSRFEDVEFHLKYAETLFNLGQIAEAAVEARLLLLQDPYHFNGNLLLAHAYQQLGLDRDCLSVCEDYLAINGHCFEFGELRAQCLRRLVRP